MTTALNQLGAQLWSWFAQLSIELAVLTVLVLLIGRLLPIKSPALRHLLWAVVLLKPIAAIAISSPWTVFTPLVPLVEPGWASLGKAISSLRLESLQAPVAAASLLNAPGGVRLAPAGWLAGLWLAGIVLLGGRMLLGYGAVWHLRRRAQVHRDGPLVDALRRARRIRRTPLGGSARRMGTKARLLVAVTLCALAAVTLPASGIAQDRDGVDWERVKTTPPEEWTQELKDQIAAAGHDVDAHDVDAIAERVRLGQEKKASRRDPDPEARVWRAAMATDPDEWSEELQARILELKPDSTIEEIAEWVRQRQGHRRDRGGETDMDLEEIGRRIREAVAAGEMTAEEGRQKMEAIRRRMAAGREGGEGAEVDLEALGRRIQIAIENGDLTPEEGREIYARARSEQGERRGTDDRLAEFKRGVIARAMATPTEEWSDGLKAAIERAGWDLAEFTEGIRQRQAHMAEGEGEGTNQVEAGVQANTSVEERSWGQVKEEAGMGE